MNQHASKMSLRSRAKALANRLRPSNLVAWVGWMGVPVVVGLSFVALSQSTPPAPPAYQPVTLATQPLYAA